MKLKATPEEIDEQCKLAPVHVDIVPYEVEVLDPNMSLKDKIAKAARICYRSEAAASDATDSKLISGCVKRGHTSVLEHGAISVFLNIRPDQEVMTMFKTILGQAGRPTSLRAIWDRMPTLTAQRYMSSFNDPDIFKGHEDDILIDGKQLPAGADVALPVIVGDVRAWKDLLPERLIVADTVTGDPISWLVTVLVAYRLNELLPEVFGDLCDRILDRIKRFGEERNQIPEGTKMPPIQSMIFNKFTDEEFADIDLYKFLAKFFGDGFKSAIAAPASQTLSVSIILTTDRAVTHEHVRHRRGVGYSQESQRWVNYLNKGYTAMEFTCDPHKAPEGVEVGMYDGVVAKDELGAEIYRRSIENSFSAYDALIKLGYPPESARKVLPNNCRTTIAVTWLLPMGFSNFVYWRTEEHAQYDIRLAADKILLKMIEMKHPYLQIIMLDDLERSIKWMHNQNIFDEKNLAKLDQYLADRKTTEAELYRQAQEERAIMEEKMERQRAIMKEQMARKRAEEVEGGGVVVDDHSVKPHPTPDKPAPIIKVGGNDQSATPSEPVTERPATIQFDPGQDNPPIGSPV